VVTWSIILELAGSLTSTVFPYLTDLLTEQFRLSVRGSVVLRRYATSRKVGGSRPDEMNNSFFFFNVPNPSGSTRPWGLISL
jgi:hypothetical protein